MSPILKRWLFVLFIAAPVIIYFLNLDVEALSHREIIGRRHTKYHLGDDMFWIHFVTNLAYAFALAYVSVQLISEEKKEPDKKLDDTEKSKL